MVYEDIKLFGPYLRKDGRLMLTYKNGRKTTSLSYPKYLMEIKLNRYLTEKEHVHHIDGNPLNNDYSNLEVVTVQEHGRRHVKYKEDIKAECYLCKKMFILTPKQQQSRYSNRFRKDAGPFCSKKCVGTYGQIEQMKKRN